jgi:predicted O-methyltransferase YrrM
MTEIGTIAKALRSTGPLALLRACARVPLEMQARKIVDGLPRLEPVDLTGPRPFTARFAARAERHAWSLGPVEQVLLEALIHTRSVEAAFEIGTFNGGTTRLIAEALPEIGRVVTIDLPSEEFDLTQGPKDFSGLQVGCAFQDSPAAAKIVQINADSTSFDFTPYRAQFDLVLVDGGHDYIHGLVDSRSALQLVRPGGVILWDDFEPYWHGLVRGVTDAMAGRNLFKVSGTSFAAYLG